MMKLITKFSEKFSTDKAISLIEMDEFNINIPYTVLINSSDIANINIFLNHAKLVTDSLNYPRYSIRISFSDIAYPHYIQSIVQKNNVELAIKKLIDEAYKNNINTFDIIFQPLLENVMWSGGIIKKDNFTFMELVCGTGKTIFREGQYIYRYLYTEISEFETLGNQNICINWCNGDLVEKNFKSNYISQELLRSIANRIKDIKYINNKIYEFGFVDNNIIFFECKTITNGSYENLEKVFIEEEYDVLNIHERCDKILEFDMPAFNHINKLNNHSSIYINGGSILSHLAFYCTQKQMPCKLKTNR